MHDHELSENPANVERFVAPLSGLMMLAIGLVLLLASEQLGKLGLALTIPGIAIGLTWLAARRTH